MQFAGRRTTLDLEPVGEPVNVLIQLSADVLPQPDAILITGITPQAANADGYTEAEFLKMFSEEVAIPGTIFVGFNTVRFDDEFMRCLHYRNFYDPYEWQWKEDRSRWDLLDVVRMTRALRPDGISWPFDTSGKPTNRLELLTALNKLDHEHAHDALSDVDATIAVARMLREKQTKLFDYLFTLRDKRKVADIVEGGQPFVYTSGQYSSEYEKTTVAYHLCHHPKKQGSLVYDLRHDPLEYKDFTPEQLVERWQWKKDPEDPRLPVKTLQYNKCPAVAPLGVLDAASQERLKINLEHIKKNLTALKTMPDLEGRLLKACEIMDKQQQTRLISTDKDVDDCIYDGFFDRQDADGMHLVREASAEKLAQMNYVFKDHRLTALLPLYKARNYPKILSGEERLEWEKHCQRKLLSGGAHSKMAQFFKRLQEIAERGNLTSHQQYILEELRLYAESIMPSIEEEQ